MAFIEVKDLFKLFRKVVALNHIELTVQEGEMLTLLGPSGCGKTTTLRCIAGLERPDAGDIVIDGKSMLAQGFVPPSKRGIGMVFQNYAVWPHMKVFNNIVYGLKIQGASKAEIKQRAQKVLEMVGLEGLDERYPSQLSGGQQQRVALARALVRNPKVLLLDEPLSNLDAKLREKMRFEIKSLVRRMGITSVYVTHDQAEAMVISDRVVVMESGNVVQIGKPEQIYETPASKFVADFIGTTNFVAGTVVQTFADTRQALIQTEFNQPMRCHTPDNQTTAVDQSVSASIRPVDVQLLTEAPPDQTNLYAGVVAHRAYLGNFLYFFVDVGGTQIRVQAPHHLPLDEGARVYLYLNPLKCVILH